MGKYVNSFLKTVDTKRSAFLGKYGSIKGGRGSVRYGQMRKRSDSSRLGK